MSWGEGEGQSFDNRVLSYKQVCKFAERGGCATTDKKEKKEQTKELEKGKHISLNICGHCAKETKNVEKIVWGGYANILCFSCRCRFEAAMDDLARRYLRTNFLDYERRRKAEVRKNKQRINRRKTSRTKT
ncbi:MAG: hypothetical protein H8D45_28115 [Bacteroidetes bacterium]|nr:hypothetical protein [Bacteroidota bacterium]